MPKKKAIGDSAEKARPAEKGGGPKKASLSSTPRSSAAIQPPPTPPAKGSGSETRHRWTFLTNHAHVLILLNAEPDLILREIAVRVGITERAIQQILSDLEQEGFIERDKVGRRNHYRVKTDHYLRHPIESHCNIADLLSLILDHPDAKQNAWL
jgi:DNA-binding MarR family transcriptional regulator